jgi:hypothetical protein
MKTFDSELACQIINLEDRRVNIRKLENWRRRYKEDARGLGFLASCDPAGISSPMESKILKVAHSSCSTVSEIDTLQFGSGPQITGSQSPRNVQAQSQAPHGIGNINSFPSAEDMGTDDVNTEPKNRNGGYK